MDINNELAIYAKYNLSSSNWLLLRLLILAIEEIEKSIYFNTYQIMNLLWTIFKGWFSQFTEFRYYNQKLYNTWKRWKI